MFVGSMASAGLLTDERRCCAAVVQRAACCRFAAAVVIPARQATSPTACLNPCRVAIKSSDLEPSAVANANERRRENTSCASSVTLAAPSDLNFTIKPRALACAGCAGLGVAGGVVGASLGVGSLGCPLE